MSHKPVVPTPIVRKTLVKKIRSEQDLKQLIDVIAADLGRVHDYLELFHKLMKAKRRRYTLAVSQSQTFWSLVYGGLHDAALVGLCRAYDQTNHDDVLTLRSLLETIQARPEFLPATASQITTAQLQKDIDSVSKEKSQAVDHLSKWRNKLYAHRDATKILGARTLAVNAPLTYRNIDTLVRRGFKIVNRYGVILFRNSYMMKGMVGANDYLAILRTLQRDARRAERNTRAHMRRAATLRAKQVGRSSGRFVLISR
jgi:hypothetical protein